MKYSYFVFLVLINLFVYSCSDDHDSKEEPAVIEEEEEEQEQEAEGEEEDPFIYTQGEEPVDGKLYIPQEFRGNNFYSEESTWCFQRSAHSDHIIVFWETGFGTDPSAVEEESMRVDIADLLEQGEHFFLFYRDTMQFVTAGASNTDNYRMMIMLYYTTDWICTGSGYDDVIGALWISPATVHPVGATAAHELGHSFQYQVYCDLGGSSGFRYAFGNGNGFWEQTSEFQSWQLFPSYYGDLPTYFNGNSRHFHHEHIRYQSYYFMEYWKEKHGIELIGKIWKQCNGDDPLQTYMRLTGIGQEELNDQYFEHACKNIIYDYPLGSSRRQALKNAGLSNNVSYRFHDTMEQDGEYYQIVDSIAPEAYGYNAVQLKVPAAGTTVTALLEGMVDDQWASLAGWRFGFVGVIDSDTAVYGKMKNEEGQTASFTPDTQLEELWLVVSGAPITHRMHAWDEDDTNDESFPYKIKFGNTEPL